MGKVQINRYTDKIISPHVLSAIQEEGRVQEREYLERIYFRIRWSGQWRAFGRGNFQIRLEQANRTFCHERMF